MQYEAILTLVNDLVGDLAPHRTKESSLVARCLIYVALNPGCTAQEMADEFNVEKPTISRTTQMLRKGRSKRQKSISAKRGLIQVVRPQRGQAYRYELTERGEEYLLGVVGDFVRAVSKAQQKAA